MMEGHIASAVINKSLYMFVLVMWMFYCLYQLLVQH